MGSIAINSNKGWETIASGNAKGIATSNTGLLKAGETTISVWEALERLTNFVDQNSDFIAWLVQNKNNLIDNRLDKWGDYNTDKAEWVLSAALGEDLNNRVASLEKNALTAVPWSIITGKPTTIAGYGITDAKIANGTITIGANSITPATTTDISNSIAGLDVAAIGGAGKYIQSVSQTDGKIAATAADMPTKLSQFTDDIIAGKYLSLTGGTMTGQITFNTDVNGIILKSKSLNTSDYVECVNWYIGGKAQSSGYNPHIGQHNTGGSDQSGAICILPYPTTTNPWESKVGLWISKGLAKLDGNTLWHSGNLSKLSQLTNDKNFIISIAHKHTLQIGSTSKDVTENGSQSWSLAEIGLTKVSQLTNDAGYITNADIINTIYSSRTYKYSEATTYTVADGDYFLEFNANTTVTVSIPKDAMVKGRMILIRKGGSGNIGISATGGQIKDCDGSTGGSLKSYVEMKNSGLGVLFCTGANWNFNTMNG